MAVELDFISIYCCLLCSYLLDLFVSCCFFKSISRIANPSTSVRLRDAPPLYYQIHQCLIVLSNSTVLILRVLSLHNFFIYLHKVNPFVIRYYFLKRY